MAASNTLKVLLSATIGLVVFAGLVLVLGRGTGEEFLGRVLQGDELLRVQVESDFDRDGDVDFQDFTVFAAFYEEE